MNLLAVMLPILLAGACRNDETEPRPPPSLSSLDFDRDGVLAGIGPEGDCQDRDPSVRPGAAESCNGTDDDCDGAVDENFDCIAGADQRCPTPGFVQHCDGDCRLTACAPAAPTPTCRSTGECEPGTRRNCATACGAGEQVCGSACSWEDCRRPPEVCNGEDDDCDAEVDEGVWGVAEPLRALTWSGWATDVSAAVLADGSLALAHVTREPAATESHLAVTFVLPAEIDAATTVAVASAGVLDQLVTVPRDDGLLLAWWDSASVTRRVATLGPEGVRSSFDAGRSGLPFGVAWTGQEIVVVVAGPAQQLLRFDPDGSPIGDPVPTEGGGSGRVPWLGDALVVANHTTLYWLSLDGVVTNEIALGNSDAEVVVAATTDRVAAAWIESERVIMTIADADGGELSRTSADLEQVVRLDSILPLEDGWLVALEAVQALEAGGWRVTPDGEPLAAPQFWLTPPAVGSRSDTTIVGDGAALYEVVAFDGLALARLECPGGDR